MNPPRREPPWRAGWHAARANLVPGLIVQSLMLALLLAYFYDPGVRERLNDLAEVKRRWSYGYSALASIVAGAFVPEVLRVVVFQKGRMRRDNLANLGFTIPFWCMMGVIVDFFYRCQAGWFGGAATLEVVVKKVMMDQFVYNPLFAAPVTAWLYDWKQAGFPMRGWRRFFTVSYYRDVIVPALFATWGVWIPVVAILYSLPSLLQIPLFALALSLWVMLYTWMSEQRAA